MSSYSISRLALIGLSLSFSHLWATGLNFQTVSGDILNADAQPLADGGSLVVGTLSVEDPSQIVTLQGYISALDTLASGTFSGGEVGVALAAGELGSGFTLYGIVTENVGDTTQGAVFTIGVTPTLGVLVATPSTVTVLYGQRSGDDVLLRDSSATQPGPSTPVEDRPAFDDFPSAQPIEDDSSDSGSSDEGSDSTSEFEGWILDPTYELLYLDEDTAWVYSERFGWAFSVAASGATGVWFFLDDTKQWYWTDADRFPYFYDDTNERYVYLEEVNGVRFLYNFETDSWEQISE